MSKKNRVKQIDKGCVKDASKYAFAATVDFYAPSGAQWLTFLFTGNQMTSSAN
jgi:hypothetical protein